MLKKGFSFALYAVLVSAFLLWFALPTRAQSGNGTIIGTVTDSAGAILQGARVEVQPGELTTSTNSLGQFALNDLPPGKYTVSISYIAFEAFSQEVDLTPGQVARVPAVLKVASKTEEVTVYASRQFGEAEAINRQRTSDLILDVLPEDVINSLPNANIADAVGRLPAVTLERDEGEGKYVQIRGTEPRLTNVTMDGITVPSPEVAVRQVKLDTIPADIIQSVEVQKTLLPNEEADAIGGTVNLVTRTAGPAPYISIMGLGGYTPIIHGVGSGQTSATFGDRFGTNKKFGIIISGGLDYNGRGIDDIEPAPTLTSLTPAYDSMDLREYKYDRSRWGLAGSLDYKLGDTSGIYSHFLLSDFRDYGDRWVYTLQNEDVPKFNVSRRLPNYGIYDIVFGGHHVFKDSWFNWEASTAYGREEAAAGNPGANFGYQGSTTCNYDPVATTDPYRPQFNPGCTAPGSPIYDPTQYTLSTLDLTQGLTAQVNLQGSASYAHNYHWGSHFGTLETGFLIRNSHKYQNATQPEYDPNGTLPMSMFLSGFANPNYYDGSYRLGPVASWTAITNYFYSNPGAFTLDESATHLNSDSGNYNLTERIVAGYVMDSMNFGRFRLVGGIRIEGTIDNIQGYHVTDDANGNWVFTTPTYSYPSYISALPSVTLRYQLTNASDIRVAYGRGISRPNPYDMVPYVVEDQSTNPYAYTLGNPSLKPEYANNYDLMYEHYLKPYGLLQAGFFFKQLHDPIYYVNNPLETSGPYAGYQVSTIINGTNANLWGVELSYIQHLSFLPKGFNGLGMSGNFAWIDSAAYNLPGRSDTPALQRQSPITWNLSPTYDWQRLSLRVGLTYNGASIFQYQYQQQPAGTPDYGPNGPAGDQYMYSHFQVDAQANINLGRGFSAILAGLNLNNEAFGFYNGSKQYVDQREYYKPTYQAGIRWTLGEK